MVVWPTQKEIDDYTRARAPLYGIDPETAVRVRRSESQSGFYGDWVNGKPTSFGPWQLHLGGLYNVFVKLTGLNPANPDTWHEQTDFSLKFASQYGWGSWNGRKRVGIGLWDGIRGHPTAPPPDGGTPPDSSSTPDATLAALGAYLEGRSADIVLLTLGILLIVAAIFMFAAGNPTVRDVTMKAATTAAMAA